MLAAAAPASAAPAGSAQASDAVYGLANNCSAIRSQSTGKLVSKDSTGYAAAAGAGEPILMRPSALGRYLLYDSTGSFVARGPLGDVVAAQQPNENADFKVNDAGTGTFRIVLTSAGKELSASGAGGKLVLADPGGPAGVFSFQRTNGCAPFPEVETSTVGTPARGRTSYGEVKGYLDAHMHQMAFEFLGGSVHCGRPWSAFGVTVALVDCPDHQPNGGGAALENVLADEPVRTHDPVGWDTFKDWPAYNSLTHEGSYYKWLERAWRGGLRTYVNLFVENVQLCELYPLKRNSCNEMESVRLQARQIRALEDYIDAQSGGPGKGWFRIVTNPFEARRVVNQGKLAVILGIEVSRLFDCRIYDGRPQCNRATIARDLDEVYKLGVRQMELVNKFDNALGGVAGDSGDTGTAVNSANKRETNRYWDMRTCDGHKPGVNDRPQTTGPGDGRDSLAGNFGALTPPGTAPAYPPSPHCNAYGLSDLGDYLVRQMAAKEMIVDPDHLSVLARKETLTTLESLRYSGVVSSHSWSTPDALPRMYNLGGVVAPYAGDSAEFVQAWRETKPMRNRSYYFGFGYGADMNGFGAQGGPRKGGNVTYPFKSFDGKVTINRQRSGQRTYDINTDGVAHYGLYPDWIEDLRKQAGNAIVKDMVRGSEAYLQMWERAEGVPGPRCLRSRGRFTRRGLGRLRLGRNPDQVLRRGGQPRTRAGRAWRYCADGKRNRNRRKRRVVGVFTKAGRLGLVASTVRDHKGRRVGTGAKARRIRRGTRRLGPRLRARRLRGGARLVYGIKRGRVRYVAVATRKVGGNRKRLRAHLRVAGVR
jgi:microsomal dipeptidase-like Zn-dependent dipeptidase